MRRAVPVDRIEGLLESGAGLTSAQAADRSGLYGPNDIIDVPPGNWRELARDTLRDPMLWFLVGTSILFAFLGDRVEAITLAVAVIPLVGMDAFLHRRTQASTRGLASRLAVTARVLRDGVYVERPASELVPGDLVEVGSGEPFPADGLVVEAENAQVDESALTGESLPVAKRAYLPGGTAAPAVEDVYWGCAGTRLLTGRARIRVAWTGAETLYGEIVRLALQGTHARTPLQKAIGRLVSVLLGVALLLCAALAVIRLYQGYGIVDALLSAVTLAVAALPEEFPLVFTFFLGAGVYRLAKRQALVRRAVAVENIGRITCICSDKTGTMTEGQLRLEHRSPAEGLSEDAVLETAMRASRADSADPLDAALLESAQRDSLALTGQRMHTFPFTEARRCEVAIWQSGPGEYLAAVKGAPETVLARTTLPAATRDSWLAKVAQYAAEGHKVIACASRRLESPPGDEEPVDGYTFTGLLAFEDPVREGVRDAVQSCIDAGIRVIMITGDHPGTAAAIAREVGLGDGRPRVLVMGEDDDETLADQRLAEVDVVARAVPTRKLQLVRMLQAQGEIVAVTGDGVNDVPALQAADIGIAMGERGTRSAREVAAIVLLDDNFRTIVGAIAEGRQLFRNLQLGFAYLLMVHIPLVLSAAIIPLAGYPLLYLPIHIVWLELLIHPTALLVFQDHPPSKRITRVARDHGAKFYDWRGWAMILLVGGSVTVATVLSYEYVLGTTNDVEHARAISLVVLILAGATITAGLSRFGTLAAKIIVVLTVVSLVALVQVPALARVVHLRPLHLEDWMIAALAGVATGALSMLFAPGGGHDTQVRARGGS